MKTIHIQTGASTQNMRLHTDRLVLFHYMRSVNALYNTLKMSDTNSKAYLKLKELNEFLKSKRVMSPKSREAYRLYSRALVIKNSALQNTVIDNPNFSENPSCIGVFGL